MSIDTTTITESATSRFARIKEGDLDLQLHYNDVGSGDETVVMLHGSGPGASGWANFNRNVEPFVAAGYRVVLIDCPGWSKSDTIVCTGSRSDLNARALKGLMDAIGLRQGAPRRQLDGRAQRRRVRAREPAARRQAGADGRRHRRRESVPADTHRGDQADRGAVPRSDDREPEADDERVRVRHEQPHRRAVPRAPGQHARAPRPPRELRRAAARRIRGSFPTWATGWARSPRPRC